MMTIEAIYIKKLKPQLITRNEYRGWIDIEVFVQMQKVRLLKLKNCSGTC